MKPLSQDLSIFKKLNLINEPVGVKFLYREPNGIEKLNKKMAICEMLKEAQESSQPFYITAENEDCFGSVTLGMTKMPRFAEAGEIGYELEIFGEPRANSRIYNYLPKLKSGVVNSVAFAGLKNVTFEPDLLFLTATISQAEIIFRAIDYWTGAPRESKTTGVFGCAWLFTYPYQTGKINYTVTGLAFGTKVKKVFPEGLIIFSIPFDWIPTLVHSLKEMKWDLPSYNESVEDFKKREHNIMEKLAKEAASMQS